MLASHAVDIEPVSGRILRNSRIFQIARGGFQPAAALKSGFCNSETFSNAKSAASAGFFAAMA
jgi:hypothetical protein